MKLRALLLAGLAALSLYALLALRPAIAEEAGGAVWFWDCGRPRAFGTRPIASKPLISGSMTRILPLSFEMIRVSSSL